MSAATDEHRSGHNRLLFFVDRLTGQRIAIDQLILATFYQSWLMIHASDDRVVVVEVSWERIVLVLFVLFGALEVEQTLAAAPDFVWPIAAFDPIVIEQALWTLLLLGNAPQAFGIVDVTLLAIVFIEDAELPRTSLRAYRISLKQTRFRLVAKGSASTEWS